jgi:hypothetical protein
MKQLQGSFPISATLTDHGFDEVGSISFSRRCAGEEAFFHV